MPHETATTARLLKFIRAIGGFAEKTHGGPMTPEGMPDVVGCYRGHYLGLEVKLPKKKPTEIQRYRLQQIRDAGGAGIVVRFMQEVQDIFVTWEARCHRCLELDNDEHKCSIIWP